MDIHGVAVEDHGGEEVLLEYVEILRMVMEDGGVLEAEDFAQMGRSLEVRQVLVEGVHLEEELISTVEEGLGDSRNLMAVEVLEAEGQHLVLTNPLLGSVEEVNTKEEEGVALLKIAILMYQHLQVENFVKIRLTIL